MICFRTVAAAAAAVNGKSAGGIKKLYLYYSNSSAAAAAAAAALISSCEKQNPDLVDGMKRPARGSLTNQDIFSYSEGERGKYRENVEEDILLMKRGKGRGGAAGRVGHIKSTLLTQTHTQTHTDTHRDTDTDTQTDTDRHRHRHTDTQTHRHTDTQTHTCTLLTHTRTYPPV